MMRPERIARFVSDPEDFVAPDQVRPAIMAHLLRLLDIEEAPEPVRYAAITEWLRTHEPMPALRHDLERRGYLPAPAATPRG